MCLSITPYNGLGSVDNIAMHCAGTIVESTSISIKTLFTILFIYLSVRFPIKGNKQITFQGEEGLLLTIYEILFNGNQFGTFVKTPPPLTGSSELTYI